MIVATRPVSASAIYVTLIRSYRFQMRQSYLSLLLMIATRQQMASISQGGQRLLNSQAQSR